MDTRQEFPDTNRTNETQPSHYEQTLKAARAKQAELLLRIENPDIDTSREQISFSDAGHIIYAKDNQVVEVTADGGRLIPRSAVLFGGEWGIDFAVGPPQGKQPKQGMPNQALVDLQRDFAVTEGNRQSVKQEHLNQAQQEVGKSYNQDMEEQAYQAMIENSEKEDYELTPGSLTEKMTRVTLAKMAMDHDLPFVVREASPYEDVEYKIDMIIDFNAGWNRGIEVAEKRNKLGVQLTSDARKETTEKKERQIKHGVFQMKHQKSDAADDVVLVSLDINDEVARAYDQWRKNDDGHYKPISQCDPRGPEQFLSQETKKQMLFAVIEKLPPHLQPVTEQVAERIS